MSQPGSESRSSPSSTRRRHSMLPGHTSSPIIKDIALSTIHFSMPSIHSDLSSGFATEYPIILKSHCPRDIWLSFITDMNDSARLKWRQKLKISPLNLFRIDRKAARVKPILTMLTYWQDVLDTYGVAVELRHEGTVLSKQLTLPTSSSLSTFSKSVSDTSSGFEVIRPSFHNHSQVTLASEATQHSWELMIYAGFRRY